MKTWYPTLENEINNSRNIIGLRPQVSNERPLIGRIPTLNNLYINVGPGMSGWKASGG